MTKRIERGDFLGYVENRAIAHRTMKEKIRAWMAKNPTECVLAFITAIGIILAVLSRNSHALIDSKPLMISSSVVAGLAGGFCIYFILRDKVGSSQEIVLPPPPHKDAPEEVYQYFHST